ncbi:YhcN/YlaJ family sporulation lipoprotein [Thalassobacillus pellis]|uniref:YhcN/YlaJ family sporulation lipoprotein n=1 Tax=Thalassobacillus pellis TaxID=748008 RepID=UPI001961D182|nr:YhcN/YlaJ family sporulation lipoprotein [Thalassobacillus pellis]MBM7554887.1 hypothetical protein [Thalassobacillus pellis]
MKKVHFTISTAVLTTGLLLAGCANDNGAMDQYGEGNENQNQGALNGDPMDNYQAPGTRNGDLNDYVGYVRYDKTQVDTRGNYEAKVNREETADMITKMILSYEQFNNAATLVTDDEVLIAYETSENMDRNQAADMAKKTAYSLVPRFYEVYVSDNPMAFEDIQSMSNTRISDRNYDKVLESIIERMRKSPQGEVTYNDETKSMKDKRDTGNETTNR